MAALETMMPISERNLSPLLIILLSLLAVAEHLLILKGTFVCAVLITTYVVTHFLEKRREAHFKTTVRRAKLERNFSAACTPLESTQWINKSLSVYWGPILEKYIAGMAYASVDKAISSSKPSFLESIVVDSFTLGTRPPTVNNMQVVDTSLDDVFALEFEVDYNGEDFRFLLRAIGAEDSMLLKGRTFGFNITSFGMRAKARAYLHNTAPIVWICLTEPPSIYEFDVRALGIQPSAIPFFNIKKFLQATLASALVDPMRIALPLEPILYKMPKTVLGKVNCVLVSCQDLRITHMERLPKAKVVFECGDSTFSAKTSKAGKDVDFGEPLGFASPGQPVSPGRRRGERLALYVETDPAVVNVRILDANNKDEVIGTASLSVASTTTGGTIVWTNSEDDLPVCRVMEPYDDEQDFELFPEALNMKQGRVFIRMGPVAWKKEDAATLMSSPSRNEPQTVVLQILRGKDLIACDTNGKSDPFVTIKYGTEKKKTPVIRKTLEPVWNETYMFERQYGPESSHIDLECFDHDRISGNTAMGTVKIPMKALSLGESYKQWRKLKGVRSGSILYAVYLKRGMPSAHSKDLLIETMVENSVIVEVLEAKNLVGRDKSGFSDPYCQVKYNGSYRKSDVHKQDLSPKFKFRASYPFASNDSLFGDHGHHVFIKIKDWNKFKSKKSLGKVSVDVSELQPGQEIEPTWYDLQHTPSGKVLVRIFRTKTNDEDEENTSEDWMQKAKHDLKKSLRFFKHN